MSSSSVLRSPIHRAVLDHVQTLALPRGAAILDAPSGDGALTLALRERGFNALAVDVDAAGAAPLGSACLT